MSFLLHHGNLDENVRQIQLEHCLELQSPTMVPWWTALTSADAHHVHELQIATHHSAMILIASFVITYRIKRKKALKRKQRLYSSYQSSQFSNHVNDIALFFASISFYLVALSVILTTHRSLSSSLIGDKLTLSLKQVYFMDRTIGILEEIPLTSQYLYTSSLWSILISTLLTMASTVWVILDPRVSTTRMSTYSSAGNAAVIISIGVVLSLASIDLTLFNKVVNGEIKIDFGLPQGLIQALNQTLSSFVGLCIFNKFIPRDRVLPAESAQANAVTTKPKKYICDPAVVQRMSALAAEASERVQARKNRKQLNRSYSEGNFMVSTPPPRSRRNLSTLPIRQLPPSPLLDIHLAGPTLSSKDLIAKLKSNDCIKPSVSSGCSDPVPEPILGPKLPNLAEEEKVHDDGSASTPTHPYSLDDLTWSNPQSAHTPVPRAKYLV